MLEIDLATGGWISCGEGRFVLLPTVASPHSPWEVVHDTLRCSVALSGSSGADTVDKEGEEGEQRWQ